jgi:hypothetical protein
MARKFWDISAMEGFPRLLLLAVAGVFTWFAWPVSLWLLIAFLAHWALREIAARLEAGRDAGKRSLWHRAAEIAIRSLLNPIAYLGFGIFLVAVAQTVLWGWSQFVEPDQLRWIEETLSWSYQSLQRILDLTVLAGLLVALMLVAILAPHADVIGKFRRVKTVVSNAAFILLGMTSFTFFGAIELDRVDPEWREAERYEARLVLTAIEEHARELTAAAWVESLAHELDQPKRQEFVRFFDAMHAKQYAADIVRAAGNELGRNAPRVDPKVAGATAPNQNVVPESVRKHLQAEGPAVHSGDQPALKELRAANGHLAAQELRMRAARTAAVELAAEAIAGFLPKAERALVDAFVQEVTGTVSKWALNNGAPRGVVDVASAKEWVKAHLSGSAAERAIPHAWTFHPSSLEMRAGATGAQATEAAIAALVSRLHNYHMMRDHALRLNGATASFNTPTASFRTPPRPTSVPRVPAIRVRP